MKRKKWRQWSSILLSTFVIMSLFSGCSGSFQIDSEKEKKEKTQEISDAEDITKEPEEENEEEVEAEEPIKMEEDSEENSSADQEEKAPAANSSNSGKKESVSQSTGVGKTEASSQTSNQGKTETETKSAEESKTESSAQNQSSDQATQKGVKSKVQLYEGVYFDNRRYGGDETPETVYEVHISGITETSFNFAIYEAHDATGEQKLIFKSHTAEFTGDGTTAAYYGNQYTLQFSFPDGHNSLPKVTEMKVSGFSPVEGILFVNNSVPGYEFG